MAKNDVGEDTGTRNGAVDFPGDPWHTTSKYFPTRRPDVIVWCTEVVPWSVID